MTTSPTTSEHISSAARPWRVLVVDDEAHIVQVLSLKLRNAGYAVVTASDGEEAFELACRPGLEPDVVITDFQMPYMTGLELCRALKRHTPTQHTPVVMLTARGYALDPDDLHIGNIHEVLSKPFSPRAIADLLAKLLSERPVAPPPPASEQPSAPPPTVSDQVSADSARRSLKVDRLPTKEVA